MINEHSWLPEGLNQFQPALDVPLPGGLELVYYEGGEGHIDFVSPQSFRSFVELFVSSFIDRRIGYTLDLERVMILTFNQSNVFGVLLLDSFEPPEISQELFHYTLDPLVACTLPHFEGIDVTISGCQIGSDAEYTEQTGADTSWQL